MTMSKISEVTAWKSNLNLQEVYKWRKY
jgi:hypothetical protein